MKAYLIGCIFVVVGIVLGALLFFGVLFKACVDVEKQQQRYANLPEVHGVITTTTPLKARFQQGMATVIEYRVMRKRHFAVDSDLDYKLERFLVGAESLVFIDSAGKRYTVEFNVNRIPIKNFSETGKYFDYPISTFSQGMKSRVAFGLAMSFDFDIYLSDESLAVGDLRFKAKCESLIRKKIKNKSSFILTDHAYKKKIDFVKKVLIVHNKKVLQYDDPDKGYNEYKQILEKGSI